MAIDPKLLRKALLVHGFIFAYFLLPNFSTLLGIGFLICILFVQKPYEFLGGKITEITGNGSCDNNKQCCVQNLYNQFLRASLAKQGLTLLSIFILSKICWFIPNWLVIILVGELYVFWSLLHNLGIFELIQSNLNLVKQSVQKLMTKIPKYQENQ